MRTQVCYVSTITEAWEECPWACVVTKVEGGYICFESQDDYATWKAQR